MAGTVNAPAVSEQRRCSCLVPMLGSGNNLFCSALGYGTLGLFLSIPFGAGAFFGITTWACDRVINWVYSKVDINQNNTIANIVKFALRFFAHAALGMLALTALGFPISLGTAALFAVTAALVMPFFIYAIVYPLRTLGNVVGVDAD